MVLDATVEVALLVASVEAACENEEDESQFRGKGQDEVEINERLAIHRLVNRREPVRERPHTSSSVRIAVNIIEDMARRWRSPLHHDRRFIRGHLRTRRRRRPLVSDVVDESRGGRCRAGGGVGPETSDGVAAGKGGDEAEDDFVDLGGLVALVVVGVEVEDFACGEGGSE